MRPSAELIEKKDLHPDRPPRVCPPPARWFCSRCRREIDNESTVCTVHEGLYIFYHSECVDDVPDR